MQSKNILLGICFAITLIALACEPVIAVGWKELLCVFGLMAFLFGPPLYQFIRKLENFRKRSDK
jgi:hypothetical protein